MKIYINNDGSISKVESTSLVATSDYNFDIREYKFKHEILKYKHNHNTHSVFQDK